MQVKNKKIIIVLTLIMALLPVQNSLANTLLHSAAHDDPVVQTMSSASLSSDCQHCTSGECGSHPSCVMNMCAPASVLGQGTDNYSITLLRTYDHALTKVCPLSAENHSLYRPPRS